MDWEQKLAKDLGLMETGQDFGIVNANGRRLAEFLEYFKTNIPINPWEWEELADLILESANEAILDKYITEDQVNEILDILVFHKDKFPNQFEYWLNFGNEEEYPVTSLVKKAANA